MRVCGLGGCRAQCGEVWCEAPAHRQVVRQSDARGGGKDEQRAWVDAINALCERRAEQAEAAAEAAGAREALRRVGGLELAAMVRARYGEM